MKPPAIWYSEQDLSKHYMRRTDRPFEEGVSRGQLRRIAKCEAAEYVEARGALEWAYPIIEDNRARKGRKYGMSLEDICELSAHRDTVYCFLVSPSTGRNLGSGPIAAAICVVVAPTVLYVSSWGDVAGVEELSPVCLLAKGIYQWCGLNNFTTLDIGIGGDPGLDAFKERLGFRLGNAK